jgi:hypothetical protein
VLGTVLTYLKTTKREHYYCDDTYYNCPKHPEEAKYPNYENAKCNCGTDEYNKKLEEMIELVERHSA